MTNYASTTNQTRSAGASAQSFASADVSNQIAGLYEQIASLSASIAAESSHLSELQRSLSSLRAQNPKDEKSQAAFRSQLSSIESQIKTVSDNIQRMTKEVEGLQAKVSHLQNVDRPNAQRKDAEMLKKSAEALSGAKGTLDAIKEKIDSSNKDNKLFLKAEKRKDTADVDLGDGTTGKIAYEYTQISLVRGELSMAQSSAVQDNKAQLSADAAVLAKSHLPTEENSVALSGKDEAVLKQFTQEGQHQLIELRQSFAQDVKAALNEQVATTNVSAGQSPTSGAAASPTQPAGTGIVSGRPFQSYIEPSTNKITTSVGAGLLYSNTPSGAGTMGVVRGSVPTQMQARWGEFLAAQKLSSNTDVNELVQFVLREAYMSNTQDLRFYAEKVRFYNDLKASIREEIKHAREALSSALKTNPNMEDNSPISYQGPLIPKDPILENGKYVAMNPRDPQGNIIVETKDVSNKKDMDTYIKNLEEDLNSVGDDAQLANIDLQNMLQKQQQLIQLMSNISKMLHETASGVIRKIAS